MCRSISRFILAIVGTCYATADRAKDAPEEAARGANHAVVPWRDDGRCGPKFIIQWGGESLPGECPGNPKEFDEKDPFLPHSKWRRDAHCCDLEHGWCGSSPLHCDCGHGACIDYSLWGNARWTTDTVGNLKQMFNETVQQMKKEEDNLKQHVSVDERSMEKLKQEVVDLRKENLYITGEWDMLRKVLGAGALLVACIALMCNIVTEGEGVLWVLKRSRFLPESAPLSECSKQKSDSYELTLC